MISKIDKNAVRKARHNRTRRHIVGTGERPRLNVYRSLNNIYAQVIDDTTSQTLASASTLDAEIKAQLAEKTKKEVPCILPQITVSDCEGPQKKSEKIVIFPQAAVPFPQFFIPDFQRIQSAEKPGKQKNQFHWSESHFPFPFPEISIVTQ